MTSYLCTYRTVCVSGVACGENDSGHSDGLVRVVHRRHLDEATKTGQESNEIDDDHQRRADMTLTRAEEFKSTAAACGGGSCGKMPQTDAAAAAALDDDSHLIASSAVPSSMADEQTSQSQYYYEYVGPTKIGSGEAKRASSRGRSLVPTEPDTAAQQSPQTRQQQQMDVAAALADRQQIRKAGNSDMEDILDGFVKLLNGQPGQPGYRQPIKTRINNRGPPRISDASVVLEPPAFVPMPQHQHQLQQPQQQQQQHQQQHPQQPPPQNKPKDPPPYPFDVPQPARPLPPQPPNLIKPFLTGVPLPEQLVPTNGGEDVDELGSPSLQYEDDVSHLPSSSRRPVQHLQTARPQQEYDLFADGHAHGAGHIVPAASRPAENVTEKLAVDVPSSQSPPPSDRPSAITVSEKPTTTDKPWSVIDINATRVIGIQVSKLVDHLTSPVVPSSPIGVSDPTAAASAAAPTTTTTTTTSSTSTSTAAESTSTTTAARPETTSAGEHVTGVGSAVVVLEPSTSEEPHRDDTHKPTDNKLPSKPTAPLKKTPQQSGNYHTADIS